VNLANSTTLGNVAKAFWSQGQLHRRVKGDHRQTTNGLLNLLRTAETLGVHLTCARKLRVAMDTEPTRALAWPNDNGYQGSGTFLRSPVVSRPSPRPGQATRRSAHDLFGRSWRCNTMLVASASCTGELRDST
jgi:hypothetical protein